MGTRCRYLLGAAAHDVQVGLPRLSSRSSYFVALLATFSAGGGSHGRRCRAGRRLRDASGSARHDAPSLHRHLGRWKRPIAHRGYALAFEFIRQHPVFGRGLSTFLPSYRILDNQYLVLIEAGIVGLVAFLALLVTALVVALRLSRTLPDPSDRSLARSLMATIACAAISCVTFDAFGFPQVSGMLFFAIGAIGALIRLGGLAPMKRGSDNVGWTGVLGHRSDGVRIRTLRPHWRTEVREPLERRPWQECNDLVVLAAGVSWDDAWMSEKQLALALSEQVPVLYVDPPVSVLTPLRKPNLRQSFRRPTLRVLRPGLAQVVAPVRSPESAVRCFARRAATAVTRRAIERAVHKLGARIRTRWSRRRWTTCSMPAGLGYRSCVGTDDSVPKGPTSSGISPLIFE